MDQDVRLAIQEAWEETAQARKELESARKRYQAARALYKDLGIENSDGLCELRAAAQVYARSSDAFTAALQKWAKLLLSHKSST